VNVLEALADRQLLGALPAFRDLSTWRSWLVFARAVYGLPMSDADLEVFALILAVLRHVLRATPRRLRSLVDRAERAKSLPRSPSSKRLALRAFVVAVISTRCLSRRISARRFERSLSARPVRSRSLRC
jgi:hypothetical protein